MKFTPALSQSLRVVLLLSLALAACAPKTPNNPQLILATTTSTQDSGLLDELVPLFEEQFGYTVKTVAVGTGAALKLGEEGNADVVLVHAPSLEIPFMENGFGKDRFLVMHNDFVIVGPAADPAGIQGSASASEAFSKIAAAGAVFVSRGDDSGTHVMEKSLWAAASLEPFDQAWYLESGQAMGATLTLASEKEGYTLTDRGTYLANQENLNLDILFEGDPLFLNIYHVITVNPDKWENANYEGALAFAQFITGAEAQNLIQQFGVEQFGQPLFFPDAGKSEAELGQ